MCQEKSVPNLLLALVNMVLEGPSIKDQIRESSTPAALSIAQILKYNSVKHMRTQADTSSSVRHTTAQETPLPIYIANAACTNLNNEFNPICSCRYLTTNSSSHESRLIFLTLAGRGALLFWWIASMVLVPGLDSL